jgi:di/tricarboxylate transporter
VLDSSHQQIPLILFPLFGVLTPDEAATQYWNDTLVLFTGSFFFANALEKWNLHKRFALRLLIFIGNKPRMLLLGVMFVSAFLSMWMSNTSTTAVMVRSRSRSRSSFFLKRNLQVAACSIDPHRAPAIRQS